MKLRSTSFLAALCAGLAASAVGAETASGPVTLKDHIKPVLQEFCFDCHNDKKQKGDLNLVPYADNAKLEENRKVWEKVAELIESREMPPEKKPQPSEVQRETVLHYIDGQLSKADCTGPRNPGKVTIRRLNREEYKNTIRDLVAINYEPEDFPNDEVGFGFDNIGDVLSLPPMLMEKYLAAAEEIAQKAIAVDAAKPKVERLPCDQFRLQNEAVKLEGGTLQFLSETGATHEIQFPEKGQYVFRVRAYGDQAGPELPKLEVRLDGKELRVFDVKAVAKAPATYELTTDAEPGRHKLSLAFLNDYYDDKSSDPKVRGDRNLYVQSVEVEMPVGAASLPECHKRLITRMPKPGEEHEVAMEVMNRFAKAAYRRPVTDAEVQRLARFVDLAMKNGGSFLEGVRAGIQASLCSPHFLFRWELDPQAMNPGDVRELNDYEVASRLSYFLWSSMPDPELVALAQKGELRKDGNLEKQVARMIQDWRSYAFVNNFAGQWLQIRNLWEVEVDPATFPKFDSGLRGAMKEETARFFTAVMKEDRPVTDLLDADFTFLNEKLARFYGIDFVRGDEFQRVTLPKDSPRGGVLTQASVLLATSTPTRTSPVIRGKWILEQILGTPPPPPPPDVPPLPEQKQINQTASLRQRLEQHRNRAECAGCHAKMDPLGFALENFDATGAWRDSDGKFPIDASGKLTSGATFSGPRDLKQVLKANKNFVRCLTEKMMTYALGRGLEHYDKCASDALVTKLGQQGNRFSVLVAGIVTSDPFLKRRRELAKN